MAHDDSHAQLQAQLAELAATLRGQSDALSRYVAQWIPARETTVALFLSWAVEELSDAAEHAEGAAACAAGGPASSRDTGNALGRPGVLANNGVDTTDSRQLHLSLLASERSAPPEGSR